jgi:hypothetical protein
MEELKFPPEHFPPANCVSATIADLSQQSRSFGWSFGSIFSPYNSQMSFFYKIPKCLPHVSCLNIPNRHTGHIKTDPPIALKPKQILFVLSIQATCYGSADNPHALSALYIKNKMKCAYVLMCDIAHIVQIIWIRCSCDRALLVYSFKYNKQDATLYNILYYCQRSTCFGRLRRPSSGAKELYTQHLVRASPTTLAVAASTSWNSQGLSRAVQGLLYLPILVIHTLKQNSSPHITTQNTGFTFEISFEPGPFCIWYCSAIKTFVRGEKNPCSFEKLN